MTQVPPGSPMAAKAHAGHPVRRRARRGPMRLTMAKGGPVPKPSPAEGARAAAGGKDLHGRTPDDPAYGESRDDRHLMGQARIDHIVVRAQHAVEAKRKGGGKFPAGSEFNQGDIDAYNRYGLGDAEKDYGEGGMVRKKYGDGGMVDRWGQNTRKYPPMGTGAPQSERAPSVSKPSVPKPPRTLKSVVRSELPAESATTSSQERLERRASTGPRG